MSTLTRTNLHLYSKSCHYLIRNRCRAEKCTKKSQLSIHKLFPFSKNIKISSYESGEKVWKVWLFKEKKEFSTLFPNQLMDLLDLWLFISKCKIKSELKISAFREGGGVGASPNLAYVSEDCFNNLIYFPFFKAAEDQKVVVTNNFYQPKSQKFLIFAN